MRVQLLYTKSRDLFHDDATAVGLGTLKQQEQEDSPKVRGDPRKATSCQVDSKNKNRKKESSKAKAVHDVVCQDGASPPTASYWREAPRAPPSSRGSPSSRRSRIRW